VSSLSWPPSERRGLSFARVLQPISVGHTVYRVENLVPPMINPLALTDDVEGL
jgi:hypothetical protein